MELRDALRRRPVTPERRVAIGEAIPQIEELVDRGEDATAAIETLNETTGHSFGLDDFHELVEIVRRIRSDRSPTGAGLQVRFSGAASAGNARSGGILPTHLPRRYDVTDYQQPMP